MVQKKKKRDDRREMLPRDIALALMGSGILLLSLNFRYFREWSAMFIDKNTC